MFFGSLSPYAGSDEWSGRINFCGILWSDLSIPMGRPAIISMSGITIEVETLRFGFVVLVNTSDVILCVDEIIGGITEEVAFEVLSIETVDENRVSLIADRYSNGLLVLGNSNDRFEFNVGSKLFDG
jgi:hypothetical protein